MAQSSSCSQMEMRLDCRSIYSRESPPRTKRTNEQASPRMSQGAAAGGVRRPRSAARRRRFTWKLRGEWRHSCAQTPGVLSGKTAEPRGNYSGVFLLPHGDVKVTELCSFKSGPTFVQERRLLLRAKKAGRKSEIYSRKGGEKSCKDVTAVLLLPLREAEHGEASLLYSWTEGNVAKFTDKLPKSRNYTQTLHRRDLTEEIAAVNRGPAPFALIGSDGRGRRRRTSTLPSVLPFKIKDGTFNRTRTQEKSTSLSK